MAPSAMVMFPLDEGVEGLAVSVGRDVSFGSLGEVTCGFDRDVAGGTGKGGVEGHVAGAGGQEDIVGQRGCRCCRRRLR